MVEIKDKIFDRRVLFICLLLYRLWGTTVLMKFSSGHLFTIFWNMPYFFCLWAGLVLLYEIIHKESYVDRFNGTFMVYAGVCLISAIVNHIQTGSTLNYPLMQTVTLVMMGYLFFTIPKKYTVIETKIFLKKCCQITVYSVLCVNLLSFIMYGYINLLHAPGHEWLDSYFFERGNVNVGNRFKGWYEWMTTGSFFCYLAILLTIILYNEKVLTKKFTVVSISASILMIALTRCRTTIIILILIVLLVIAKKHDLIRKEYILGVFILLLLSMGGFLVYALITYDSFIELINDLNVVSSGRITILINILYSLRSHFWIGNGIGNMPTELLFDDILPNAHNLFGNLLMFSGVIGFAVFVIFAVLVAKELLKRFRFSDKPLIFWMILLVICVLVQSMLDIAVIGTQNISTCFFWLFLGYLVYGRIDEISFGSENIEEVSVKGMEEK